MQEVVIRLRFVSECLGSAKRRRQDSQVVYSFPRDVANRVVFLPSRWRELVEYAAKVANVAPSLVTSIDWDPAVDGSLRPDWRRIVTSAANDPKGKARYACHEAFSPGSVIAVNAVLPDGLSLEQFSHLLEIVGKYKGFSPFQNGAKHYGRFDVVSVKPAKRALPADRNEESPPSCEDGGSQ